MRREDLDRKLARLHDAAERISSNLVELEIDSSRQAVEASTLEGESAARRSAASKAITELWRRHQLLEGLLERADRLRGSRHADELQRLLEERSIELWTSEVPLAERDLLGSAHTAQRCSADELLGSMSASFDEVKTTIARIEEAWATLIPKLDAVRRLLRETRRLAEELGESARPDLEPASQTLNALSATVATDPLSANERDVDSLAGTLQTIRDDLERSATLRHDFDARIREARDLLEQVYATVREGQAAHDEVLLKISAPQPPPAPQAGPELERELRGIAELGRHEAWRDARNALENWRTQADGLLEEARRALRASRAPIETRNQYRELLEAYQVKAARFGVVEDPRLADISARARAALYTAPTDLALAAGLVRSYQLAVNGSQIGSEAMR